MSEQNQQPLQCRPEDLHEALSIHTRKVTDSCRDKDCIEDLRVYLTTGSQALLDRAASAKVRNAELLFTDIDVEPISFDRFHYCIDVTFYYRILADAVIGCARPAALYGLAVFSKRAVLCGEDSHTGVFTSNQHLSDLNPCNLRSSRLPVGVVEALDPMVLSSKVRNVLELGNPEQTAVQIPAEIQSMFDEELVHSGDKQRLFVTLGQFSIIRLEREAQLVVPVLDYSIPTKECCDTPGCAEDPCEMFSRIPFPAAQFTPTPCSKDCPGREPGADGSDSGYRTLAE